MIELIATVVITVSSIALFAYWFRYTCLLILSAKTARDYTAEVAYLNKLGFPEVQTQLRHSSSPDLDRLRAALDKDYRIVRQLIRYMPQARDGQSALETYMLAINYRVMSTWYEISRHFSGNAATRALEEMSTVIAHFANLMGEQAAVGAAA